MKKLFIYLLSITIFSVTGCSDKEIKKVEDNSYKSQEENDPVFVKATLAEEKDFHYELLSNGVLSASNKVDLRFPSHDIVRKIYVKNGQRVTKGQVIAELDKMKLEISLLQAIDNKEKADLDLQDVLIGQGYSLKDSLNIPPQIMKIAKIRSNYDNTLNNYKIAKYNFDEATLKAPFSGVIANLNTKEYNVVGNEFFCTVIDNQNMEVVFNILEGEIPIVNINNKVHVSLFSDPSYVAEGYITEINPVVDKNGMIQVKAKVYNKDNKFYEGMNVRIRVQRILGKRIAIPKPALLIRNNRKVVFTVKNGKAIWNYVETAQENSESFVVTEGIQNGDSIIYDGNFNLAHESDVICNHDFH